MAKSYANWTSRTSGTESKRSRILGGVKIDSRYNVQTKVWKDVNTVEVNLGIE